jgi:hypothetical protein
MAIFKKIEKIPNIEKPELKTETNKEKTSVEKKPEKTEEKIIDKKDQLLATDSQSSDDKQEISESQVRLKKIDDILAFGLNDIFLTLSPEEQHNFKAKGEETRDKINLLLNKAKINVGKIIKLIKKWLSILPKVNRFFLEQEAKIKADKIIKLKKY